MPDFVVMIGPQAVGKMAVGKRLAEKIGYNFSHNHHSIELGLEFFEYGTPAFNEINEGVRKLIFDTMIEYEQNGFVFTYVTGFNREIDLSDFRDLIRYFTEKGWTAYVVELTADLEIRLQRNRTDERLKAKASKRDVEASEERLLKSLDKYVLNSTEEYPFNLEYFDLTSSQYLKLDNTELNIDDQVDLIRDYFEFD